MNKYHLLDYPTLKNNGAEYIAISLFSQLSEEKKVYLLENQAG